MSRASLLSLDDALLDRVIGKLAEDLGARGTVAVICLISKRFTAVARQPLSAWISVKLSPWRWGLSSEASAYLARWLTSVSPGIEKLVVVMDEGGSPPWHELPIQGFLGSARSLKELHLQDLHLLPAELGLVGLLTKLTSLYCECYLPDSVQLLSSLASLRQLRMLHLMVYNAPTGSQLPSALSGLSGLEDLTVWASTLGGPTPHLRLPWAWCQAATKVTSLQLACSTLPLLEERSSGCSEIFPAMQHLALPRTGPFAMEALSCCRAVQNLRVEGDCLGVSDFAAISLLPRLQSLALLACCFDPEDDDVEDDGEPPLLPQTPSFLSGLTFLCLAGSPMHPTTTQLPALRKVQLTRLESGEAEPSGWALPGGPWLRSLEALQIQCTDLGSVEAALRQATRLTSLRMEGCLWLQFKQHELPLLLQLPLKELMVEKSLDGVEFDPPSELWDEEMVWVAEQLRKAFELRGPGVHLGICIGDS